MAKYQSNGDKMLQSVLEDADLMKYGEYNEEYDTIDKALCSDNVVVQAVAQILQGVDEDLSEQTIYNSVTNFLKTQI